MNYWNSLLLNWNACRIVRIIAGTPILIMGISRADVPTILFGVIFVALGLFTTQCCTSGACTSPPGRRGEAEKTVQFEEIK